MLSSALGAGSAGVAGAELSGAAAGGVGGVAGVTLERWLASSEADDSGTGELAGAVATTSFRASTEGRGAAGGGVGSLARGAVTDVSPVNGFLYSLWGVMTSRADGLKPAGAAGALGAADAAWGRLPRRRPEPRVAPNVPNAGAGVAEAAGAGAGADKSAGA